MSIVLAFSGGLDTSFCVPYLTETTGQPVHAVTVNTGGLSSKDAVDLEARASELGAASFRMVDGRADLYRDVLRYLVFGNVLRGGVYPLCVGPERVVQAKLVVEAANDLRATTVAHGSTGAGNDQVRFDVALRLVGGSELEIQTPIRDLSWGRTDIAAYLEKKGFAVPVKRTAYSINSGLWGTTIGGTETLTPYDPLPESAYATTVSAADAPDVPATLAISFDRGEVMAIDGLEGDPVSLIEKLNEIGGRHGIGRGVHVGDTVLGIKGRVGFEAPAALMLIAAHRELEKIVLTKWQRYQKDHLGDFYGMLVHEGQYFDPVMRDIEALFESSQSRVTGTVSLRLFKGHAEVLGCNSPFSMFDPEVATYGETNALWSGRDAEGFARITGVPSLVAAKAEKTGKAGKAETTTELLDV